MPRKHKPYAPIIEQPVAGTVTFDSPAAGSTITGLTPIRGTTSATPITSAEISVDGDAYRPITFRGNRWRGILNTVAYPTGSHTISIRLNGSQIATRSVTFGNPGAIIPGVALQKLGNTSAYNAVTNKDKFSYFQSDPGAGLDSAISSYGAAARVMTWCHGVNVGPGLDAAGAFGVPYSECDANGWLLRTSTGALIPYGDGYSYITDISNPNYRARLIDRFINNPNQLGPGSGIFASHPGVAGCMLDNVQSSGFGPYTTSTQITSVLQWRDEMFSLVKEFGSAIQDAGYMVNMNTASYQSAFQNAAGGWPAMGNTVNGQQWVSWIQFLAPYTDLVKYEYWMCAPTSVQTPRVVGETVPQYFGDDAHYGWGTRMHAGANAAGIGMYGMMMNWNSANQNVTDTTRMSYLKAIFLLDYDPRGAAQAPGCVPHDAYSSSIDVWNSSWTKNMGNPSGAKTQPQPNLYKRVFANGTVYVNANPSGSLSQDGFTIPGGQAVIT